MSETSDREADLDNTTALPSSGEISEPTRGDEIQSENPFEPPASVRRTIAPQERPRCWYCAVAEAFGWFGGTLMVHAIGGISVALVFLAVQFMLLGIQRPNLDNPKSMMVVIFGEMALFVLASILAVSVRYWGRTFDELNLTRPNRSHVFIVIGGTLPLSFCVTAWSVPVQFGWQYVCESYPSLKLLDQLNTMKVLQEMSQAIPLYVLIFVVAVLPAIGEELVFRGAIGRVLISNIGLWGGVLLTSILFGLIHIHPVHALSVIPLGIAIHVVYLWTRSFWLPMLLHFMNNTWASIIAQVVPVKPAHNGFHVTLLDGIETGTGFIAAVSLGIVLWQSRIRLFQNDGTEWYSPRVPIRVVPIADLRTQVGPVNRLCWGIALLSAIVCHIAVVFDLLSQSGIARV